MALLVIPVGAFVTFGVLIWLISTDRI